MNADRSVIRRPPRSVAGLFSMTLEVTTEVVEAVLGVVDAPHAVSSRTLIAASRLDDAVIRIALLVRVDRGVHDGEGRCLVEFVEACADVVNAAHIVAREASFEADDPRCLAELRTVWPVMRPGLLEIAGRWRAAMRERCPIGACVRVPEAVNRRGPVAVLIRFVDEYLESAAIAIERLEAVRAVSEGRWLEPAAGFDPCDGVEHVNATAPRALEDEEFGS